MSEKLNIMYAPVPTAVLSDESVSYGAKLLLGEIISLSRKKGYCYAKNRHFSVRMNTTKSTINRWLTQLDQGDYISRERIYSFDNGIEVEQRYIYVNVKKLNAMNELLNQQREIGDTKNDTGGYQKRDGVSEENNEVTVNNDTDSEKSPTPYQNWDGGDTNFDIPPSQKRELPRPKNEQVKNTLSNTLNNTINNTHHRPIGLSATADDISVNPVNVSDFSEKQAETQKNENLIALENYISNLPIDEPQHDVEIKSRYRGVLLTKENLNMDERDFLKVAEVYPNQENIDEAISKFKEIAKADGFNTTKIITDISLKARYTNLPFKEFLSKHVN